MIKRRVWLPLLLLAGAVTAEDRQSREAVEALKAYAVYKMANYEEAFARFLVLAEKGNTQGMLNAANMLQAGLGVDKDEAEALVWYRRAADQGSAIGMYYTGRAYEAGQGVDRDLEQAKAWYHRASDGGSSEAELALGKLLLNEGRIDEGREWLQRSADNGDVVAQRYLTRLSPDGEPDQGVAAIDRALIEAAWDAIDRAAANRNAPGVVYYLSPRAEVRVRLPGAAAWVQMDKWQLLELWQQTFTSAEHYTLQRSTPTLHARDDMITVDSVIDEVVVTANGTQTLRLTESAAAQIVDDAVVIHRITLEIDRL